MQKALLTSILVATIAIPIVAARDERPRRGLQRAVLGMVLFDLLYMVACVVLYPRLA